MLPCCFGKGTWRVQRRTQPTIIHVNKNLIGANNKKDVKEPVIIVRKGSKVTYCSEVSFVGHCKIVYQPDKQQLKCGAKVWIEVDPSTQINLKSETIILEKEPSHENNNQDEHSLKSIG